MKYLVKTVFSGLLLSGLSSASSALSVETTQDPDKLQALEVVLQRIAPGSALDDAIYDEKSGMYLLISDTGGKIYSTLNGDRLFVGDFAEYKGGEFVNLTQKIMIHRALTAPSDVFIVYPPSSGVTPVGEVTIFFDVGCQYCRLMHQRVKDLNDFGVAVRYLPYPRGGLQTPDSNVMRGIWCRPNARKVLDDYLLGLRAESDLANLGRTANDCGKDVVAQGYYLGRSIGIKGTPAVLFNDLSLKNSFMKASDVYKRVLSTQQERY